MQHDAGASRTDVSRARDDPVVTDRSAQRQQVAVEVRGLSKAFGTVAPIRDLNLEIFDGEFLVILGPSGSGKSTLLRLIAGLEQPTAGQVLIDGRDVTAVPARDRGCGFVFQSYALFPHMTVLGNIAYGLRRRGVARKEAETRAMQVAKRLSLGDLLQRRPRQLSGGQRQRVALGRVLARQPRVFLFDEPLSSLDAQLRTQMRTELVSLHRQLKATSIFVTHDQVEAMTMGDRVAVLHDGRLQQLGGPLDLYERPTNVFVARFVGSPPINLFRCTREGSRYQLGGVAIPAPTGATGDIDCGLRPEATLLRLEAQANASPIEGRVSLRGRLALVERLGAEAFAYVRVGDQTVVCRVDPDFMAGGEAPVLVDLDLRRASWFDAASGDRLVED
ncbi:MAG: ABC transporter ATP-binding protein [Candidatus Limnocylindrales bacterium]